MPLFRKSARPKLCLLILLPSLGFGQAQSYLRNNTFTNWESPHVHPLDLTPDGSKLLAVNTANNTLDIFDSSNASAKPVLLNSIPVGLDPVSVRARTNTEAWVVNVISDSVSVVDLRNGIVTKTLAADDEPADVIFAGPSQTLAFVSCAQAKTVLVFSASAPGTPVTRIPINGEQPRALAKSSDGRFVYLAIFESGNLTTEVTGGKENGFEHDIVRDPAGPYGGVNVPPNSGKSMVPAMNSALPPPPPVSVIVKKTIFGGITKWLDDNAGDWSRFISGNLAQNGTNGARVAGWDLPDRDVAIIDTNNDAVTYQPGLMNIVMAISVNPASGEVTAVGTDATNQVRWEPNLQSTFIHVDFARFKQGGSNQIADLNPHLTYKVRTIPMAQRLLSIGDPRGLTWNAAGTLGYVAGMGSNNIVIIDNTGARKGLINVGQGPTGVVLQEADGRAFVLNKFDATISTINISSATESGRTPLANDPTPAAIKAGRPFLYNTHLNSGLGQAACASCHVDARWDRLAWDLGNPTGSVVTNAQGFSFHPMKGPMLTQTLVDTMQAPFFHWRGDRPTLEDFGSSFQTLLGGDAPASEAAIQALRAFLSTITLVPNPNRNLDNSYSAAVQIVGPNNTIARVGNATLGAAEFEGNCRGCHPGQTNRGAAFISSDAFGVGQLRNPPTWKNFYKRTGLWFGSPTGSNSGFGFQQDGSFDSTHNGSRSDNLMAFMMSFNGGYPYEPSGLNATNWSNYTHSAVGKQVTLSPSNPTDTTGLLAQMLTLADGGNISVILKGSEPGGGIRGWLYLGNGKWQSDSLSETGTTASLLSLASAGATGTFTAVPVENAVRLGIDMDGDGVLDADDPNPTVADFNVTNLALKGSASAISVWDANHSPAQAIDGNTLGYFDQNSLFHSGFAQNPWWQVDLGTNAQISLIQLFDRWDCCGDRLANVSVFVSQVPFASTDLMQTRSQAGVHEFLLSGQAGLLPQIPMQTPGRYVRVQLNTPGNYLQLAEVRVFGYPIATFVNPGTQGTQLGGTTNLPLTLTNPQNAPYTFSAVNLPPGLAINQTTGVITGKVSTSVAASYAVTVNAIGFGNPSVSFTWYVLNGTFKLSASITSLSVQQGSTGTLSVGVTPVGTFTGSVNFATSGLPFGTTVAMSSTSSSVGTSLSIVVPFSIAVGTYPMTVIGTAPGITVTTAFNLVVTAAPTGSGYDVVLLVGQSNMVGAGTGPDNAADAAVNPRVMQWNPNNSTIVPAVDPLYQNPSSLIGPGLTFGKAYLNSLPANRSVMLVGAASGGTSFISGRWQAPSGDLAVTAVARANAAMAAAGPGARFAGIIWHQGEADVMGGGAAAYSTNLNNLISLFRSNITGASSTTPFVVGELSYDWLTGNLGNSYGTPQYIIQNVFHSLPDTTPYTAWVSAAGLPSDLLNGTIHFSALAERQFGRRYADKFFESANNLPQPEISVKSWNGVFFDDGRGLLSANPYPVNFGATVTGTVTTITDSQLKNVAAISQGSGYLTYTVPAATFNGSYTKMVWFKPGQGNFYNNLISANNPGQLHFLLAALLNANVVIMAGHSASVVTTDVTATVAVPPNGGWMNIALVYDAGATTMTIYVNGKLAATQSGIAPAPAITGTVPVTIGSFSSVAGQYGVDGSIAGARAWNSSLSSAQINSIYNYELFNRAGF